jgi:hypothetical protein
MADEREQFIGWIADRFIERHSTPVGRDQAMQLARANLEYNEGEDGAFGHPDFSWTEADAHALADEEVSSCWETAT